MITAIVTFAIPHDMTAEQWFAIIDSVAPRFRKVPGLVRKHFLFQPGIGGGAYLWQDRAAADAFYNDVWRASLRRIAIGAPQIVYYETQIVVDNAADEISIAA